MPETNLNRQFLTTISLTSLKEEAVDDTEPRIIGFSFVSDERWFDGREVFISSSVGALTDQASFFDEIAARHSSRISDGTRLSVLYFRSDDQYRRVAECAVISNCSAPKVENQVGGP